MLVPVAVVVVVFDELAAVFVAVVDWATLPSLYDDDFSGDIDEWSGVERVMVNAVDSSLCLLGGGRQANDWIYSLWVIGDWLLADLCLGYVFQTFLTIGLSC
ncbi:hypothetical protein KPH14_009040 [Odynerus spinipes]|uniref:Secreted protein n=1 Tax=Odynerus spinipes TaxID=1348599 RepID=A0AAD9VQI1_9HYME|nr:hypothetical protein KPH14_009040 [Odynerus spinipes]